MRRALLALFLTMGGLLVPAGAQAHEAEAVNVVTGDYNVSFLAPPTLQQLGNTCLIGAPVRFDFTGGLRGSFTGAVKVVKFGQCAAAAPDVFEIVGVFDGSVLGRIGTFRFFLLGKTDPQGHTTAAMLIGRGTAQLAGLEGQLRLIGQAGVGGSYSGTVSMQ